MMSEREPRPGTTREAWALSQDEDYRGEWYRSLPLT